MDQNSSKVQTTVQHLKEKIKDFSESPYWNFDKKICNKKVCYVSTMEIGDRLAIKSVVENISASPSEISKVIERRESLFKFYPTLKDIRTLKKYDEKTKINYHTFPGNSIVDDRDFLVINHS